MAHLNYKYDFTVEVFIVCEGKVLLRFHDKYNKWLSVGGHVELDEDFNEAAIREVKEEVGLDVKLYDNRKIIEETDEYLELIPPIFVNKHHIKGDHWHIANTFFATSDSMEVNPEYEDDISEDWKWLSLEEIEKMDDLSRTIKFYSETALKTLAK